MNTNSNIYTIVYTSVVCILVAGILAFVSQALGPKQAANEKAETISQILTAAQFGQKEEWQSMGNAAVLDFYRQVADFDGADTEIFSVSQLKALNHDIKNGKNVSLPVYKFKNGIRVVPVYGAGLWGPVWGYIALEPDGKTIAGAYFDHESETPGLGGKIKDDPSFRAQFKGKVLNTDSVDIVQVDAISGASMTSKGLDAAIDLWLGIYTSKEK